MSINEYLFWATLVCIMLWTIYDIWYRRSVKVEQRSRANEREFITYLLAEEIENVSNPMLVDREYLDGLERALEIVKGENK